jgi:hypothetical protein
MQRARPKAAGKQPCLRFAAIADLALGQCVGEGFQQPLIGILIPRRERVGDQVVARLVESAAVPGTKISAILFCTSGDGMTIFA